MCFWKKKEDVRPIERPLRSGESTAPAANAGAPDKPENKMKVSAPKPRKNIHLDEEPKGEG